MPADASRLAAAAACRTPVSVSGASVFGLKPAYRFCTDIGVCPCLSSRVAVGSPWAEIQAVLAGT
jgi:hypothetical protein